MTVVEVIASIIGGIVLGLVLGYAYFGFRTYMAKKKAIKKINTQKFNKYPEFEPILEKEQEKPKENGKKSTSLSMDFAKPTSFSFE